MADGPQVVILAAGLGTRMRSSTPKVLHTLGGRALLDHVLDTAAAINTQQPFVVVHSAQPQVRQHMEGRVHVVAQRDAGGTADALRSVPQDQRFAGEVVVLSADVPLVRVETVRELLARHRASGAAATILTLSTAPGTGLGRIARDEQGRVLRIVEERDLTRGEDHSSEEIEANAGVYVFDGRRMWPALDRITAENAQGEYYLTDIVELLAPDVTTLAVSEPEEAIGINDRVQLAAAEAVVRRRTLEGLMLSGVTIEDPLTTYVDSSVSIGPDSVIHPMTHLRGATRLGGGAEIGPGAQLRDVVAGERVRIQSASLEDCRLGDDVSVGPFCRIRPNTVLESGVQLGTHAEVKNSTIGAGSRVNHFSCVLDSDVGREVNVGAGTVTCNFDGSAKHRTTIEDRVFIGSNSTLVAPLRLGEGSYVAAGSVVTADVPAGALAVGRTRQRTVEGWVQRHMGGPV